MAGCTYLHGGGRGITLTQGVQGEAGGVPELVTEEAVPLDPQHVQVDVTPWGETEGN